MLRDIYAIRHYLSKDCLQIIIQAFITSRLDYCNSLLYDSPDCTLQKLQRIQNTDARLLTHCNKYDHITPVLIDLHWLPVRFRIQFKILLLVYKALNDLATLYIKDLLHYRSTCYSLRSVIDKLLAVPRTKLKTIGDRSYWN